MKIYTFVMNQNTKYQEILPSDERAGRWVNKYYLLKKDTGIRAIPDGCLDLQLVRTEGKTKLFLCGTFLQETASPVSGYDRVFGMKLQPGVIPEPIRRQVREVSGSRMEITLDYLLEGMDIREKTEAGKVLRAVWQEFSEAGDDFPFQEMAGKLDQLFLRMKKGKDTKETKGISRNLIASAANERILKEHGNLSMNSLAEDIGYSLKYLDRCFRQEYGIPMKRYAVIIRMQTALLYLMKDLSDYIYEDLGFYDQAYFIRQCRQYTGMTPRQLVREEGGRVVR